MKYEYLLFNLLVIVFPLVLSFWRPTFFLHHWGRAWKAVFLVAIPYIVWDAYVTGAHWTFNEQYILGYKLFGLPWEEIMFFITVPFACLFSWQMFFKPETYEQRYSKFLEMSSWLLLLAVPVGAWLYAQGKGYTGLMLIALGGSRLADAFLGTRLYQRWSFWINLVLVAVFTLIFNAYLTWRPVVQYGESYQIGFRVFTIPIEDFGYGLSLMAYVTILFERFKAHDAVHGSWLERFIERRLGGYRQFVHQPNTSLPTQIAGPKRVAVVGGGLAGMTAAAYLGERGFDVTLMEKEGYLGGKAGAWTVTLDDGFEAKVEHGFHAFFRHYYNLNNLLDKVGVTPHMKSVGDYMILTEKGEQFKFKDVATTPGINLLSLSHHGVYRFTEIAFSPAAPKMESFMRYEREKTFERWDDVSFAQFAEETKLPRNLMLIFNTFARAFFADADRISMGELIKSFHFYYLSHDHGLIYDYLDDDYDEALLKPFREFFAKHNVKAELDNPVTSMEALEEGFEINGDSYDYTVLATDVVGTRAIVTSSDSIRDKAPGFVESVETLKPSQRYSVLRIWTDRDINLEHPVFVITERRQVLDAVTLCHRAEKDSAAWVEENGGAVLELHCYAVPDDIPSEKEVRQYFLEELEEYFPEIKGYTVLHEYMQLNRNFTAFHRNLFKQRPTVETEVPGLFLAGDWVKLPYPAMLMEAACMSGLLAANAILEQEGVQTFPVESVPLEGILSGLPERPV